MSRSLNRASLIGNVGRDPETRTTQAGTVVATFSLATSEQWTDKASGEKVEKTQWHRVVVWDDRLVDVAEKYIKKGSKVFVEGRIENRKYVDKDGHEREISEIVLNKFNSQIIVLDLGGATQGRGAEAPAQPSPDIRQRAGSAAEGARRPPRQPSAPRHDLDDDIPF